MKKLSIVFVLLFLLAGFGACMHQSNLKEPVTFYYLRPEYSYGNNGSIMGSEQRECSGHGSDLNYLLSLYLTGPLDDTLLSPFPPGVELEEVKLQDQVLTIALSKSANLLSGMDLTIACSCLSTTCFELTNADQIAITSPASDNHEGISVTISRDSLTLTDDNIVADTSN